MKAATHSPSRVGEAERRPDGSARCLLHIPVGHPASRMLTINGNVIEVENTRVYTAGPRLTTVRVLDPRSRRLTPVAFDLLPASPGRPALQSTAEGLEDALRQGARAFDLHAHTPDVPSIEWNTASPSGATGKALRETPAVRAGRRIR